MRLRGTGALECWVRQLAGHFRDSWTLADLPGSACGFPRMADFGMACADARTPAQDRPGPARCKPGRRELRGNTGGMPGPLWRCPPGGALAVRYANGPAGTAGPRSTRPAGTAGALGTPPEANATGSAQAGLPALGALRLPFRLPELCLTFVLLCPLRGVRLPSIVHCGGVRCCSAFFSAWFSPSS